MYDEPRKSIVCVRRAIIDNEIEIESCKESISYHGF
jgi:hypothetical protein